MSLLSLSIEVRALIISHYLELHYPRYCRAHQRVLHGHGIHDLECDCPTNIHMTSPRTSFAFILTNKQLYDEVYNMIGSEQQMRRRDAARRKAEEDLRQAVLWQQARRKVVEDLHGLLGRLCGVMERSG